MLHYYIQKLNKKGTNIISIKSMGDSREANLLAKYKLYVSPTNREAVAFHNVMVSLNLIKGKLIDPETAFTEEKESTMHLHELINHGSIEDGTIILGGREYSTCAGTNILETKYDFFNTVYENIGVFSGFLGWAKAAAISSLSEIQTSNPVSSASGGMSFRSEDGFEFLHQLIKTEGEIAKISFGTKDDRPEIVGILKWDRRSKMGTLPDWWGNEELEATYRIINTQVDAIRRQYRAEVSEAMSKMESAKKKMEGQIATEVAGAIRDVVNSPGWTLDDCPDDLRKSFTCRVTAHHKPRIYCTHFAVAAKDLGMDEATVVTLALPKKISKSLYVEDIYVSLTGKGMTFAIGKGPHPHINNAGGGFGSICLGDFAGSPMSKLSLLAEGLKTVNLHSAYGRTNDIRDYVSEIKTNPKLRESIFNPPKPKEEEPVKEGGESGDAPAMLATGASEECIYAGDVFHA